MVFPSSSLWSPISGLPLPFQANRWWQPLKMLLRKTAWFFSVFLETLPRCLQTAPLENSWLFSLSESSVSCLDFIWYTAVLRNWVPAIYSNQILENTSNTTNEKGKQRWFVGELILSANLITFPTWLYRWDNPSTNNYHTEIFVRHWAGQSKKTLKHHSCPKEFTVYLMV